MCGIVRLTNVPEMIWLPNGVFLLLEWNKMIQRQSS